MLLLNTETTIRIPFKNQCDINISFTSDDQCTTINRMQFNSVAFHALINLKKN